MVAAAAPYGGKLTSTYRSYSEQLALYLNRANSPYPAAPPGRSYHQAGRAFDINAPDWVLQRLGAYWESIGGRWGGRFTSHPDPIHFEA